MNDIASRVTTLIQHELGIAPERVGPRTRLHELGDSLDWLSLVGAVETEFGVEISEAQEQALQTVEDLIRFLQEPAAAQA
jgi:acyl carrier protein